MKKSLDIKVLTGLALLSLVVFSALTHLVMIVWPWVSFAWQIAGPLPSDNRLIGNFEDHHSDFERLRDMAAQDWKHKQVVTIAPTFTHLENDFGPDLRTETAIPSGRWDLYRVLFDTIGSDEGVDTDGKTFDVYEADRGFAGSGVTKGYYFGDPAGPVVPSLDALTGGCVNGRYFRRVAGRWYLFLECE